MSIRTIAVAGLVALFGAASVARAGEIRGTLSVSTSRPRYVMTSSGTARATKLRHGSPVDAVVYVDSIPAKVEKKLLRDLAVKRVEQRLGTFIPSTLAVAAGDVVVFENRDTVYHNVFSVSPGRRFDIGKYPPGETRTVRFDRPGARELFCELDPEETGFVFVTPNHAFTQPDGTGAFSLPKLPPGHYTLTVWYPRRSPVHREIEVPRRGALDLTLHI